MRGSFSPHVIEKHDSNCPSVLEFDPTPKASWINKIIYVYILYFYIFMEITQCSMIHPLISEPRNVIYSSS